MMFVSLPRHRSAYARWLLLKRLRLVLTLLGGAVGGLMALRLVMDLSRRPMTFSLKEMIAMLLVAGTAAALSWMIMSMFVDEQRYKLN
jgi:hypothetical protein